MASRGLVGVECSVVSEVRTANRLDRRIGASFIENGILHAGPINEADQEDITRGPASDLPYPIFERSNQRNSLSDD